MGPHSDDKNPHTPKPHRQWMNITKCCLHPGTQTSGSELREEECGGKEESQKLKTDQIHQEMEKTNNFPYFVLVPKAEKILSFFFYG